jgi:hypothetical protein
MIILRTFQKAFATAEQVRYRHTTNQFHIAVSTAWERRNISTAQQTQLIITIIIITHVYVDQGWAIVLARGPLCGSGGWRRAAPFKMIAFIS